MIERCVCCGVEIPEGRQVCHGCDRAGDEWKAFDFAEDMCNWMRKYPAETSFEVMRVGRFYKARVIG